MSVLVFAINKEQIKSVVSIVTITQIKYVFIILVNSVIYVSYSFKNSDKDFAKSSAE